jgi:two-component system, NtrC family, sensor histidine kinase HydH
MKLIDKKYIKPIIIGIVLFILLSIWTYREKSKLGNQALGSVYNSLTTAASILQGVIRYQYDGGGHLKQLEVILQNIIKTSTIKYIVLKRGNKIIFDTGTKIKFPEIKNKSFFVYKKDFFYKRVFARPSRHGSENHANDEKSCIVNSLKMKFSKHSSYLTNKNGNHSLVMLGIVMNDEQYFYQIKDGNTKLLIIFLIFAWIYFIKSNNLKVELKTIKNRAEQLEELGLAAAGLAHETKNPLGIIRGFAQKILSHSSNDILLNQKIASMIIDEVDVTTERLSDFMNYAKFRTIDKVPVQAKNKIEEIINLLQPEFEFAEINLKAELEDITIEADIETLSQIIINLAQNSLEACCKGNNVILRLKKVGEYAGFSVIDDGPGIDSTIINDIYKPYIKGNPNGHGIGLTIVKRFVDDSGWEINTSSSIGKGTSIVISKIKIL